MYYIQILFTALFGLVLGSFMNVLIYRLPREKSIVAPGSHCPHCKKPIRWYSNVPIFSFLLQKGRCRDCGGKISWQYPAVEFITALLFVSVFLKYGATPLTFKYCIFVFLLVASAFTDLFTALSKEQEANPDDFALFPWGYFPVRKTFECGVIPNIYTVGGVFIGYLLAFLVGDVSIYDSLAGSGAGVFSLMIPAFLYYMVRKREGMGDGDAILMGMVGSFLGAYAILFVFTVSAVIGVTAGLAAVIIKRDRQLKIPYAPMICAAAVIYLFI